MTRTLELWCTVLHHTICNGKLEQLLGTMLHTAHTVLYICGYQGSKREHFWKALPERSHFFAVGGMVQYLQKEMHAALNAVYCRHPAMHPAVCLAASGCVDCVSRSRRALGYLEIHVTDVIENVEVRYSVVLYRRTVLYLTVLDTESKSKYAARGLLCLLSSTGYNHRYDTIG